MARVSASGDGSAAGPWDWWCAALAGLGVDEFAARHAGVVGRSQCLAAGMARAELRRRLRRDWSILFPGVYLTVRGEPSQLARAIGALFYAGRGAMWSHRTAAGQLGLLRGSDDRVVDVTVPADRRVRPQPGLRIHRVRRAGDRLLAGVLPPRVAAGHAVVDLLEAAPSAEAALALVADCCQTRRVNLADVVAALDSRPSRWGEVVRRTAIGTGSLPGSDSLLEVRYVERVERRHRLPASIRQRVIGPDVSDCSYHGYAVSVELDGRLHLLASRRWRDLSKDNRSALRGELTLHFGWHDVDTRPCEVAAQVLAALRLRGYTGAARRCGPDCPLR